jgi:hypothetical protein
MRVPKGPNFWANTQKRIVKIVLRKIYSWRIGGFKAKNKLKNYVFVTHYLTGKLAKVLWCQQKSGQVFRVKAENLRKTGSNI